MKRRLRLCVERLCTALGDWCHRLAVRVRPQGDSEILAVQATILADSTARRDDVFLNVTSPTDDDEENPPPSFSIPPPSL